MKKRVIGALLALSLVSGIAQALTLDEARSQGRVGETLNGYLAPLRQDRETLALVERINKARTESYQQLADSNNIPVDDVANMAGQKLVARAKPGEYVRGINGKWLRKSGDQGQ
ncbi:YdbL family protein [Kosakonia cowanii]|uniref:YdbL family protein n=1 Tax=Kosakonia cowanii TaxID=208223 RepID=UPI0025A9C7F0|nr:YdbL family protein [Kosakonia cowanii]MDM9615634.1 YdbL family protein [Kosakonia cowanii]MDP4560994.1 YdbL family protein [Kosakonia cowanii]